MMAAGHLLPDVEQQGVVALLGNVDGGFKEVVLAHLPFSALRRGDVDHLGGLRIGIGGLRLETDTLTARVEVYKTVVVPQHAVTLARQQHGQAYLSVDLCQSAG